MPRFFLDRSRTRSGQFRSGFPDLGAEGETVIKGLVGWQDRDRYYTQTNNSIETFNKSDGKTKGWSESCGPTSATTLVAMMGTNVEVTTPGGWKPQPEQVLWDYLNDPRNFPKFKTARPNLEPGLVPGNRVPQYYPVAVQEVFGRTGAFREGLKFDDVAQWVAAGKGVQLCLKDPGHYIPVVAFDDTTNELIFHDPFPLRFPDGNGFSRRLTKDEFQKNVQTYGVFYS